jgi:hypothetical protein
MARAKAIQDVASPSVHRYGKHRCGDAYLLLPLREVFAPRLSVCLTTYTLIQLPIYIRAPSIVIHHYYDPRRGHALRDPSRLEQGGQ